MTQSDRSAPSSLPSSAGSYPNAHLLAETSWLADHLDDPTLRIVDLRPKDEYEKGHIPNAVNVALDLFRVPIDNVPATLAPPETIERLLGGLGISNDTTVVVYDRSTGLDASRFLWTLEYYGHGGVRALNGGMSTWQREGRPLTQQPPTIAPALFRARPQPERLATAAQIVSLLREPGVALVDARSREEYTGRVAQLPKGPQLPMKRSGRIPGAVHVDWVNDLDPDRSGRLKPAPELLATYEAAGVTRDKQVITYCRTGHRAAHSYLALRLLGYPDVRVYDGSWAEWNADPELPAEREYGQ